MELQITYNDCRVVLVCEIKEDKLLSIGEWTEIEMEDSSLDESYENESDWTSDSEEYLKETLSELTTLEPEERRTHLEDLLEYLKEDHHINPLRLQACVPVLKNMLLLEKDHEPMDLDGDEKSTIELCLELLGTVLEMGAGPKFLEEGCLPVVLESFQFISSDSATMLWGVILTQIIKYLEVKHIENAIPIIEKNIDKGHYVSSAVAYNAYFEFIHEYRKDEMVIGKLLTSQVVRTMHVTLENPIWPNCTTVAEIVTALAIGCEHFRRIRIGLYRRGITSTICSLLTNSRDLTMGEFELLEGRSPIRTSILDLIPRLMINKDICEIMTTEMNETISDELSGADNIKKDSLGSSLEPKENDFTEGLKKERSLVSMFILVQHIFLKATSFRTMKSCATIMNLLIEAKISMYEKQSWQSFFKAQEVTEKLVQLLPSQELKFLSLVAMLLTMEGELCYTEFVQNGLGSQAAKVYTIMNHENEDLCLEEESPRAIIARTFKALGSSCNGVFPEDYLYSEFRQLRAAIRNLNEPECLVVYQLEVIRNAIGKGYIDFHTLRAIGLVQCLIHFLTGFDTDQQAQRLHGLGHTLSLDDTKKLERNTRIRLFLKVFLGLSVDGSYSTAVKADERSPFIKLLGLLQNNFILPTILEDTADSDEKETEAIDNFFKQHGPKGRAYIYNNKPQNDLDSYLLPDEPLYVSTDPLSSQIAVLLKVLYGINKYHKHLYPKGGSCSPIVSNSFFISKQIDWSIRRHLDEQPYSNYTVMPLFMWAFIMSCPFLVSVEARLSALRKHTRSLIKNKRSEKRVSMPNILIDDEPAMIKVTRRHVLEETRMYLTSPIIHLNEITAYFGNESVEGGPGVTREFYSVLSKEIKSTKLGMWHHQATQQSSSEEEASLHVGSNGLFNRLYPKPSCSEGYLMNFELLGKLMAKVLVDGQVLDLNIHENVYKFILEEDYKPEISDLCWLDPALGKNLKKLKHLADERQNLKTQLEKAEIPLAQFKAQLANLKFDGVDVKDLNLVFTLPGYPDIQLIEGGRDVNVILSNLEQYVELIVEQFLKKGISKPITAIRDGFASFFPINMIKVFYPEELKTVFAGNFNDTKMHLGRWISESTPCEGYTKNSTVVRFLAEIVADYDHIKQISFVTFVSGFPRLIINGDNEFENLLRIGRLIVKDGDDPDDYFPKAATCDCLLMVPEYTSKQIMKQKMDIALDEARNF